MITQNDNASEQFKFNGDAQEWFGIWIVNLLLSIATIGVYSAWAKVRRKKYFANHTYVDGRNFDYHATGKQIFIGRLIVIGAYIGINIVITLVPLLVFPFLIAMIFLLPWLVVRSMMFNAKMTSFSNVRFNFIGKTGRAILVYVVYPILTFLTLYTTFPLLDRAVKKFTINNHRLGTASLNMQSPIGPFYKAFLIALAWIIGVGVIGSLALGFSLLEFTSAMENIEQDPEYAIKIMSLFYLLFFLAFLPAIFIYSAMIRNTVYNSTTLEGGHRFRSTVSVGKMLWIAVSNLVVVAFTFGFMLPWAQVRMSKYLANNTALIPGGSLDEFIGTQQEGISALGDAYSDLEGFDVGLPV